MKQWMARRLHRWDNAFWVHWLFIKHEIGK